MKSEKWPWIVNMLHFKVSVVGSKWDAVFISKNDQILTVSWVNIKNVRLKSAYIPQSNWQVNVHLHLCYNRLGLKGQVHWFLVQCYCIRMLMNNIIYLLSPFSSLFLTFHSLFGISPSVLLFSFDTILLILVFA